ncbi:MAG: xylulokinase [Firmicutes bacterium]|nr:xylulokinase [Bacillota bacterium]
MATSYFIGIDLGTSGVKLILVDETGRIHRQQTESYPIAFPHPGWSEQSPEDWWDAVVRGLKTLTDGIDVSLVKGIGTGGQMHGLVALDENDNVIRPAILWNDGRTAADVDYLNNEIGKDVLAERTANIAFAGFTAPKLLWMRREEPENFARIRRICLPKDYLTLKLTGILATDYSDASGMLLLDVKNKDWSDEMLALCSLTREQMPKLMESYEIVGELSKTASEETGLPQTVKVAAGAGDNAAAAVGTGTVKDGDCNLSLGTSGTLFIASDTFGVDPANALHSFAHASGRYHLMGCMLSAASCNAWLCDNILKTKDYAGEQKDITEDKLGNNHVYFLPYLMGERSPINDTNSRGTLIGMTMDTSRADIVQAVLEGVAFALRDSLEVARDLGLTVNRSCLCGGGARSPLWRTILANVLNVTLEIPQTEEGPSMGGAMLAMVGCGLYPTVEACCDALVHITTRVEPTPELTARYEARYQQFRKLYPALKPVFPQIL